MTNAMVPGWYDDPTGRNAHRYWDGARWTDHVGSNGVQAVDPWRPAFEASAAATPPHPPSSPSPEPAGAQSGQARRSPPSANDDVKITAFNAKKVAGQLQTELASLRADVARKDALLADLGAVDAVERGRRIEEQRQLEAEVASRLAQLQHEVEDLEQRVLVNRDRLVLEEVGLFDFEHPAESSASLATQLESLRSEIRQTNKIGSAITATSNFTFNNSIAKGRTFVNQMSRIMLRAYNAEAENAVKTVKAGNLASAQKRLSSARDQIAKQGTMIDLAVTQHYHRLRLTELELAAKHLQAVAAERELERERRAQLREQKQLEAEIKRAKEKLEKERTHYLNSIARMRESGNEAGAEALQAELDRIDAEIAQVDYRAANIRAGYVYVISNIGAFGEGIVKIGMTRRLEPMDRVKELGDASVPFVFDVHALFFSDDAVSIEAMLHREFAEQRLNKVNPRKEFFKVDPQRVLDALQEHKVSVLEFRTHADADEFRMSWPNA